MIRFLIALLLLIGSAEAHDWYTGTENENGFTCCGGQDCAPLADGDVDEVQGGYFVKSKSLFVPYSRTQASADKQFHICIVPYRDAIDNAPRCFFAPMPGS